MSRYDEVYVLQLNTDENVFERCKKEYVWKVIDSGYRYYLHEIETGGFMLYSTDPNETVNAYHMRIVCPHHDSFLVPKSNCTVVCPFCNSRFSAHRQ